MSRARPLAALAAAGALLLLGVARPPAAHAFPGDWSVGLWSGPVSTGPDGTVHVTGTLSYEPRLIDFGGQISSVEITLTRTTPHPGCPVAVASVPAYGDDDTELPDDVEPPEPPETPYEFAFEFDVTPQCNGAYTAAVVGTFDGPSLPAGEEDPADDDEVSEPIAQVDDEGEPVSHAVDAAAPDVQGLVSTFNARTRVVGLGWQTPPGYGTGTTCQASPATDHPDFAGYVVQRSIGEAPFATLATGTIAMGTQCFNDQLTGDAPLGTYRYRVLSVRTGTAGPVLAAGGSGAVVTVAVGAAPPATTPPTAAPPGTIRVVSPGGGGGGGGGGASGTVPPLPDEGSFEETLDYPEPGEEAAVVPDDADAFLDFVPSPGPGILVPFAVAECLAVWAFHLRYLARRADGGY